MNTDPKTGEKRGIQQKNRQKMKKGKWTDKKDWKNVKGGCERCGRNHDVKNFPMVTGAYFRCKEIGHQITNCPQKAPQKHRRMVKGGGAKVQTHLPKPRADSTT